MTTILEAKPTEYPVMETKMRTRITGLLFRRDVVLVLGILIVGALSTALHPDFLASGNISFMLADSVAIMVVATGQTMVVVTRGIDLSVSPILGIAAIAIGFPAQNHNLSIYAAIVLVLVIGAVLGAGNGFLVAVVGIPPIIATLATLSVYGGMQFIFSGGNEVNQIPNSYTVLGGNDIVPGVPWLILVGAAIVGLATVFLTKTSTGRAIFTVGDNEQAAFNAGIRVRRITFLTYVLCGLFAGIGGFIYLCHTGSADSTSGSDTNVNLMSIAAALIGGAALTGGRGSPIGAALGSIFLSVALTAMVFARIDPIWQPAGVGALILLAVVTDRKQKRDLSSMVTKKAKTQAMATP
jgi:ribose/xylose/arabinose/galactoside ABC-type transport system permease subunit